MTDFDYLANRNSLIEEAFEIVGVKRSGQPLTAGQVAEAVRSLNLLVKSWTNKHVFLWNQVVDNFDTTANNAQYSVGQGIAADALGVDRAFVVVDDSDLEIEVITWSKYWSIQNKEQTGRPQYVAFWKADRVPYVYLWPTPDAAYTIRLLSVLPLKDMDNPDGYGDVTSQFQLALAYGLAELLNSKYPQEFGIMQRNSKMAREFFAEAKRGDRHLETNEEVESLFSTRRR